jgi:predicted DNA-binding ribbon-helix-helix protein
MHMTDTKNQDQTIQTLERNLHEMEAALEEHYCTVGKQLLEVAEREDHEINQLVDRIIEAKKQLSALQQEVRCPHCFAMNARGSNYCSACGQKISELSNSRKETDL